MNSANLNEQLRNLYLEELPEIYNTINTHATPLQVERMHGPFMMHVYPEYTESRKKLMFVGMETHGWEDFKPNEDLLDTHRRLTSGYESFMTNREQPNSPFWWFIRDLNQSYGQGDLNKTVLWTNLSKIDIEKNRPTGKLYDNSMNAFISLLSKEISIVKPDILIIMTTSPNYGYHVREYFGVHTGDAAIETIIPRLLYKWSSEKLPFDTFQICHPNSLRFKKGGFTVNASSIIKMINQLAQ
ncbi:hypothetical protein [Dyadobacter pollutisoli]|uniref:Uracil-DNA glycosylase-like domain-containing protein n=1 Tax=Dyadobacter pollutisoli TaxID=2910158 RepID=A0A9E8NF26_9BACT|nr:hypothetical protein [Dyadobacter pollutisoli]WAC12954.1 hypothetical protein ON006_03105 [Dyadobacter pollutisoli]